MPETLREQQFRLAAHLRDPGMNPPPPGIEDRRLAIYRELFFNNIEGLLAGNFPVIHQTLGEQRWRELAREFYAQHRSRTPLFAEIGREFIRFLQERAQDGTDDPAWLAEMAHYEWVELALQINDDEIPAHQVDNGPPGSNLGQALLSGVPVLSPTAWALSYTWPVPHIGPDYQPTTAPEASTLVLVRRDRQYEIRFAEISPLVYRLIEILRGGELSGREALEQLAGEAGVANSGSDPGQPLADFVDKGALMLQRMHEEDTILGTRP